VGGGRDGAVSLQEYTALCREATGRETDISEDAATNPVDIPWYVSDNGKINELLGWSPQRRPKQIVEDISAWVRANEASLGSLIV
jgi:CDP-paratose 2-epimerase